VLGIDTDAQRLVDVLGAPAPEPRLIPEIGKARSAACVPAVADGAIVDKQGLTRPDGDVSKFRITAIVGQVQHGDSIRPGCPLIHGLGQLILNEVALGEPQESGSVGRKERPSRQQNPHGKPDGDGQGVKDLHRPGNRGVQLGDAAPFVARGMDSRMGIARSYRHGLSSSSRI
jgi:hypothetical protein